jgi:hypothetical protein
MISLVFINFFLVKRTISMRDIFAHAENFPHNVSVRITAKI